MKDCIEIIKNNASNFPDKIAVIDKDRKISYSDFILMVNSISHQLLKLKAKPRILIDLEQSGEAYALIIAILNVGGTYCPLNPNAPIERKKQIINEFSPDVIVIPAAINSSLSYYSAKTLLVEDLLVTENNSEIKVNYDKEDTIYVIYTSGTTGIPKGVQITRKSVNQFLEWAIPAYKAGENDIWGQFSLLSFDLSIVDILTCLCSGAALYAMNNQMTKKYRPAAEIENAKITIWHSIPSAVEFMIKNEHSKIYDLSSLRLMSFCGEPLKKHHVEFLLKKNKNITIFNTYGPTEGTLFCAWEEINSLNYKDYSNFSMSLGKPIPGWNLLLQPVEGSEEKEIIIYGNYLSKGYLNDASNNKFKKMVLNEKEFDCFETGDLVKTVNGNLYFSCRKDRQVKIKGYRIELDEIDFRIHEFLKVPSVTIDHNERLFSFIEVSGSFDSTKLRNHLETVLEDYKIPNNFYPIPEIPRSQNQKIDITALKEKLDEQKFKNS